MKTKNLLPIICTIALLFIKQNVKAKQLVNLDGPGLEIASTLTLNDERISGYTLIIYDETQSSDTIEIAKAKSIYLKLSYGHIYSLRYIKQGFRERVVMINTRVNEEKQKEETGFDFEIEMIPQNESGNTICDLPVAVIEYNYAENNFEYSRAYHRQVRGKEIKETDSDN
ncbi:MAG TPA: hypothetical protein VFJ43_11350 [Bacteroidia bacterium]|nr:hypothetical protein [Bacteroidia bacterium]